MDRFAQKGVYWTHAGRHFGLEIAPVWKRAEQEQLEQQQKAMEADAHVGNGNDEDVYQEVRRKCEQVMSSLTLQVFCVRLASVDCDFIVFITRCYTFLRYFRWCSLAWAWTKKPSRKRSTAASSPTPSWRYSIREKHKCRPRKLILFLISLPQ